MKVTAKAKSSFYHGNTPYNVGDTGEFTKAEAQDMEKSGLIKIVGEVESKSAETGAKMESAALNKMEPATATKSTTKK